MRNPDRIKPLLLDLSELWEQYCPDWRFMQLVLW